MSRPPSVFNCLSFAACIAMLAPPAAQAATITDPTLYVGIADGGLVATVSAAGYQDYVHIGYWSSLSGGEMLVSVAPEGWVTSATISAAWSLTPEGLETADYTKVWHLTFAGPGAEAGSQLWKETGFAGSSPTWWQLTQPFGQAAYVKIKFEAITSEGTVVDDNGGLGYRGLVPEPASMLLCGLGTSLFLRRRRTRS